MGDELISIKLWVAGRGYGLRIKPEDEEAVRRAVKQITEQLQQIKQQYKGKDEQDFLAMCLLMYASELASDSDQLNDVQLSYITEMEESLDKALTK